MSVPTRAEVESMVRARLADDPAFRASLMENPRAVLSALLGLEIPDAVNVEVHEESLAHVHLVIPAAEGDGEVSDDELELVAGGACWSNVGGSPGYLPG